jgi:DegV family protein with EDD domain
MAKIAIITDTDSSLPPTLTSRYHINQVPIAIIFGNEAYAANYDMDDKELFVRVDREKQLPTTSAPSTGQFAEAFKTAFNDGYDAVICICVSSEVSATYAAAVTAREMYPEWDITVVDSKNLSMGQGFMVLAAAEAVQQGKTRDEVIAAAVETGARSYYFAGLSTLKYLAMSGRVGYLAAGMATIFNIQPILTIRDGKLDMLEKVRTRKKSLARLIELVKNSAGNKPIERMAIIHVNTLVEAREFEKLVRAEVKCPDEVLMCELGPGLSVHSGAGMIGVSFILGK